VAFVIWPVALAAAATGAAALLAAADGALVTERGAPEGDEPPSTRIERDRAHRSFAIARLCALVVAGAGLWWWIDARPDGAVNETLLLVLGALIVVALVEGIARSTGDALGPSALRRLRPVVRVLRLPVTPVVALGMKVDTVLERLLPPTHDVKSERAAASEQFREVVSSDSEVTREERVLLHGVFTLDQTTVQEVMVPRVEVVAVDRETPWSEVVDRLRSSGHARMPVFATEIDDVVGILYAKDLLPAIVADDEPAEGWASRVRPATFIPATKTLDTQLRDFKASGTHIAIVMDEYGGMAGVITIEDILEQIVGEIRDEHDEEDAELETEGNNRFWASGRLPIDELSAATGHDFSNDYVTTVGGLVYARLGRVPKAGESFLLEGFRVIVERVVRRRIMRVYFERLRAGRGGSALVSTDEGDE
jgi:CBS domain containing-hemolysin-like protein